VKKHKINILSHLYYNNIDDLVRFNTIPEIESKFFYNICQDTVSQFNLNEIIKDDYKKNTVISSPNIGKDIGGKLVLIDLAMRLNPDSDFYLFLHDKKSPHTSMGEKWKERLLRIIQPDSIGKIIKLFENNEKIGIVCSNEFVFNEYDNVNNNFNCSSNEIIKQLMITYDITPTSFDFVGGTMFWIRAEIIHSFFSKHAPLDVRASLEKGNILDHENGTLTHAWERILSWLASDMGFYIKGI
jgi:lipopolysaccharide biosynthesis protein